MLQFLGADPGVGGGLAILSAWPEDVGGATIQTWPMPGTDQDLLELLVNGPQIALAVLEEVHSSPQMGVRSAFTFGREFGRLRMALVARGFRVELVRPQRWQTALGCLSGGNKNKLKARAQELFPGTRVTLKTADAILLAEYARRVYGGAR
jgi:hypothetical protein